MAEVSFNISSSQALKVRLDPTDLRGQDVAGQPVLRLPLKLQLLPSGQPQTPVQYTLLRLAGSVLSNSIGEFASFESGPLVETSNSAVFDRHVDVLVALDRMRVKRFEDVRSGANAQLQISLSGLVWLPAKHEFERVYSQGPLQVIVPKSQWVDEVVSRWGLSHVKLIEIAFPESSAGENYRAAYSRVEAAERHFANGNYKDVLVELWSAFEGLAKSQGCEKPDQQYFARLFADSHPKKKEAAKLALDNLCDFFHLGRHQPNESPDTFQILRADARFALTMAHAIFEYITPHG
ncbi:MAG TPA: hypothetical protein VGV68_14710 [Terriglobia bacterium]|nr:hypothetical protein [Terriglobia bacterium]